MSTSSTPSTPSTPPNTPPNTPSTPLVFNPLISDDYDIMSALRGPDIMGGDTFGDTTRILSNAMKQIFTARIRSLIGMNNSGRMSDHVSSMVDVRPTEKVEDSHLLIVISPKHDIREEFRHYLGHIDSALASLHKKSLISVEEYMFLRNLVGELRVSWDRPLSSWYGIYEQEWKPFVSQAFDERIKKAMVTVVQNKEQEQVPNPS